MRGIPDSEYRGTFDVIACTEDDAVSLALAKFKDAALRSGVSWARETTRVSCVGPGDRRARTNTNEAPRMDESSGQLATGAIMSFEDAFDSNPDVCGGQRVFRGTGVAVRTVLASLARGESAEDILRAFPALTRSHLRAAIAFAALSAL